MNVFLIIYRLAWSWVGGRLAPFYIHQMNGVRTLRQQRNAAEVSGHFGSTADVSYGHFGSAAEVSRGS